jgi:hypothetical protein
MSNCPCHQLVLDFSSLIKRKCRHARQSELSKQGERAAWRCKNRAATIQASVYYLPSGEAMLRRGCRGRRTSHRKRWPSMLQVTRCLSLTSSSPVTAALWRKLTDGCEGFAFRSHLRSSIAPSRVKTPQVRHPTPCTLQSHKPLPDFEKLPFLPDSEDNKRVFFILCCCRLSPYCTSIYWIGFPGRTCG